jgi:hypothetical protein
MKTLLSSDSSVSDEDKESLKRFLQIPIILPYSAKDPQNDWFLRVSEVDGLYVDAKCSISPLLKGRIEGNLTPLVTRILFYPFAEYKCVMKEFIFTSIMKRVAATTSFRETLNNETLEFYLPVALPIEEFTLRALSNHGANYTCIPPFELYGVISI